MMNHDIARFIMTNHHPMGRGSVVEVGTACRHGYHTHNTIQRTIFAIVKIIHEGAIKKGFGIC